MSRTPSKAVKTVQMAFLRIGGYKGFLMPSDAAMKVAALLQNAVTCEETLEHSDVTWSYQPSGPVEVEFKLVRANQVRPLKQSVPDEPVGLLALPAPVRRLPR